MPRGVRRLRLAIDDRTDDMPTTALECRSWGHNWKRLPTNPTRRDQLLRLGQVETIRVCQNSCGLRKTELYDAHSFETLSRKYEGGRENDYYLPTGTGRLPRREAMKAHFVRENPEVA